VAASASADPCLELPEHENLFGIHKTFQDFGGVESCLEFHAQELTHYQFFGTVRTCWNFDSCILRDSRHVKPLILLILVRN